MGSTSISMILDYLFLFNNFFYRNLFFVQVCDLVTDFSGFVVYTVGIE